MGQALTTQLATAQRLLHDRDTPPPPTVPPLGGEVPVFPHASGLDAKTIAALHAQAAGVHNIRSLVPVVLDPASSHYPRWRTQVVLTLRRFALADHIHDEPTTPMSPSWVQMDIMVISWLHGTIIVVLQDIIPDRSDIARQAWLVLEDQFLGNWEACVLHLDAQFHLFSQGELSVDDYCCQMKGMADSLRDLGEAVVDHTLVLNLLRSLSSRYDHLKALIKRTVSFPTFHVVRNELLLELTMTLEAPAPGPALYSAPPGGQAPSRGHGPHTSSIGPPARPPATTPAAPRKGERGGGSSTRGGSTGRGGQGQGQGWPSVYNPWTATISMWPGQAPSASRPPAQAPALLTAPTYRAPSPPTFAMPPYGVPPTTPTPPQLVPPGTHTMTPWSPLAGGWDIASLAAAYSTMVLAPPSLDWVVDSGASYHTIPTAGMLSRSHPHHSSHPTSIVVGNGSTLPVTFVGVSVLPGPFYLNDLIVAPHITHKSQSPFCPSVHHRQFLFH
jgi:hypothetical protein